MAATFDASYVRQHASPGAFSEGQDYHEQGAVVSLARRGNVLEARVEGSQPRPYHVRIAAGAHGIRDATCTCPYRRSTWCKHVVAALLAYLSQPDANLEIRALETLLGELGRDELSGVLLRLAFRDGAWAQAIEDEANFVRFPSAPGLHERAQDGLGAFRRQVSSVVRSFDRRSLPDAAPHRSDVAEDARATLDQVWTSIRSGDGRTAVEILATVTSDYVEEWPAADTSDGPTGGFINDLDAAWTEALLTASLSSEQRQLLARKLATWSDMLDPHGIEGAFYAAEAAAVQGWDHPSLQWALRGFNHAFPAASQPVDESLTWSDHLIAARLNVLERQERFDAFLRLAAVCGESERYALMLVHLGRAPEAVKVAMEQLSQTDEALHLALALRELNHVEEAIQVVEHGLTLSGNKAPLAAWTSTLALAPGQRELARVAAVLAFKEEPTLAAYLRVEELAGEKWPSQRTLLLDYLRTRTWSTLRGAAEVFLHEGLIDDAIKVVNGSHDEALVEQVASLAAELRPDWVIQVSREQVEALLSEGNTHCSERALLWLTRAQAAYRAAGRDAQWRAYRDKLIRRYVHRPSLRSTLALIAG